MWYFSERNYTSPSREEAKPTPMYLFELLTWMIFIGALLAAATWTITKI